jgi:hypothetical protein
MPYFRWILYTGCIFWQFYNSKRLCSKLLIFLWKLVWLRPLFGQTFRSISRIGFFWRAEVAHRPLQNQHIKEPVTQQNLNINSNPFEVFTTSLCNIYRQKFIEIRGRHLKKFPLQSMFWRDSLVGDNHHHKFEATEAFKSNNSTKNKYANKNSMNFRSSCIEVERKRKIA